MLPPCKGVLQLQIFLKLYAKGAGIPVEKELRDFEVSKMLVSNAESKAKFQRSQSSCRCFEPTYNFFTNILRFFREFFDMRLRTYLSNPLEIRGNGKAQYECEIFFEEC